MRYVLGGLTAVLGVGLVLRFLADGEQVGAPAAPAPAPGMAASEPRAPLPAVAEPIANGESSAPALAEVPPAARVAFPDGSWQPALNGVSTAVRPVFHPRLAPFATVVGKVTDASGREWYVHANGVRSTVFVDASGQAVAEVEAAAVPLPDVDGRGN